MSDRVIFEALMQPGRDWPDFADVFHKPEWQERAACRGTGQNFHPARGEWAVVRDAKAVCAGCAVRDECLSFALEIGEHDGIWGGLSERERRRLRHSAA